MTVQTSAFLGTWNVGSIPQAVNYEYDKTAPAVASAFVNQMQVIYSVFSIPSGTALDQTDVDNIKVALTNLKNLALGTAFVVQNPDGSLQRYFLTVGMVQSLDLIMRSFQSVGAADPAVDLTLDQLNRWKDFTMLSPTVQNALFTALNAITTNRSIQSIVELDYVTAGNDLIADKLGGLEGAITTTKDILSLLTNIQNARNAGVETRDRSSLDPPVPFDTTISLPSGFTAGSTVTAQVFQGSYIAYNSNYYTAPLFPLPKDSLFTLYSARYGRLAEDVLPGLAGAFNGISAQFGFRPNPLVLEQSVKLDSTTVLTASGMALYDKLYSYKQQMSAFKTQLSTNFPDQVGDANSLYATVTKVYDNLAATFTSSANNTNAAAKGLFAWLVDNDKAGGGAVGYSISGLEAGDIQANVNTAITAAEALNDTQKENVRNFLFVFEEFYKSASAVLQRISQMIEKMASNISR